jgi:hypothetical protein
VDDSRHTDSDPSTFGDAARHRPRSRRAWALVLMLWTTVGASAVPSDARIPFDAMILFAADTPVPRSVQEFASRVIETRCAYQHYEYRLRSFWAYHTRATKVDAGVVYSINILSEVTWKRTEPPAVIEMTVVDDGRLRLTGLKSSYIPCTP